MNVIDLAVFVLISGVLLDTLNSQETSLGDVRIVDGGKVEIYYTDGTLRNATWGTICTDPGSPRTIGLVICRQLGYQNVGPNEIINGKAFDSDAVIRSSNNLHGFNCGDNPTYSHILQCAHTFPQICHNKPLFLTCSNQRLSDDPYAYDGQVRLCPPKGFPIGNQSVSTGLVLIHLHQEWRGINQLNLGYPIGSREGDSICRQLGYTGSQINVVPAAWFTTDDPSLQCGSSSQDCIGCCFQYPPSASDHCTSCTNTTDVVITCTYDITILRGKAVTRWSARNKTCSFQSGKSLQHSACTQQDIPLRTFEIVVGSVGSVAVLLLLILIVIIIVATVLFCRIWLARRHHGDRQLVREDPDEN